MLCSLRRVSYHMKSLRKIQSNSTTKWWMERSRSTKFVKALDVGVLKAVVDCQQRGLKRREVSNTRLLSKSALLPLFLTLCRTNCRDYLVMWPSTHLINSSVLWATLRLREFSNVDSPMVPSHWLTQTASHQSTRDKYLRSVSMATESWTQAPMPQRWVTQTTIILSPMPLNW